MAILEREVREGDTVYVGVSCDQLIFGHTPPGKVGANGAAQWTSR